MKSREGLLSLERTLRSAEYEVVKVIAEMDELGVCTGRRHALAAAGQLNKAAMALLNARTPSRGNSNDK